MPITRLVITGCPLPSINRIVERGLDAFPDTLQQLEVNECAFRGDNFNIVTRRIKKHAALQSIKVWRAAGRLLGPGGQLGRASTAALVRAASRCAKLAVLRSYVARCRRRRLLQVIQSGALKKYKNCRKDEVAALFKAKLNLKRIAICVPWWDAANMQRCAKVRQAGGAGRPGAARVLQRQGQACAVVSGVRRGARLA